MFTPPPPIFPSPKDFPPPPPEFPLPEPGPLRGDGSLAILCLSSATPGPGVLARRRPRPVLAPPVLGASRG